METLDTNSKCENIRKDHTKRTKILELNNAKAKTSVAGQVAKNFSGRSGSIRDRTEKKIETMKLDNRAIKILNLCNSNKKSQPL